MFENFIKIVYIMKYIVENEFEETWIQNNEGRTKTKSIVKNHKQRGISQN